MFLPSAHGIELVVHCDDDGWNHLEWTQSFSWIQRHLVILVGWRPSGSPWSSPLRSSLPTSCSRRGVGFSEFVVFSWNFFLCHLLLGRYKILSPLWRQYFFCIDTSHATNVSNVQCALLAEPWWWYAIRAMLGWEEVLTEVYNYTDKICARG